MTHAEAARLVAERIEERGIDNDDIGATDTFRDLTTGEIIGRIIFRKGRYGAFARAASDSVIRSHSGYDDTHSWADDDGVRYLVSVRVCR